MVLFLPPSIILLSSPLCSWDPQRERWNQELSRCRQRSPKCFILPHQRVILGRHQEYKQDLTLQHWGVFTGCDQQVQHISRADPFLACGLDLQQRRLLHRKPPACSHGFQILHAWDKGKDRNLEKLCVFFWNYVFITCLLTSRSYLIYTKESKKDLDTS